MNKDYTENSININKTIKGMHNSDKHTRVHTHNTGTVTRTRTRIHTRIHTDIQIRKIRKHKQAYRIMNNINSPIIQFKDKRIIEETC